MATLKDLETNNKLHLIELEDLDTGTQLIRSIYACPVFLEWVDDWLAVQPLDRRRDFTPKEQVEEAFELFITGYNGYHMSDDELKKLNQVGEKHEHVWEFRTADVRIFGYFYRPKTFIAVCGEMRKNLKTYGAFRPYIERVVAFRKMINLDIPMCMESEGLSGLI